MWAFEKIYVNFWMVPNWNLFSQFSSFKKNTEINLDFYKKIVFLKILFLFFSQHHSHEYIFSIPFASICITISLQFNSMYLNSVWEFEFNSSWHAMWFNIFIWMEFNFHKNNSFLFFSISWVDCHSFIVQNEHRAQVWIGFSESVYKIISKIYLDYFKF